MIKELFTVSFNFIASSLVNISQLWMIIAVGSNTLIAANRSLTVANSCREIFCDLIKVIK